MYEPDGDSAKGCWTALLFVIGVECVAAGLIGTVTGWW